MDVQERIDNFKNMAEADPENQLGHFSLGKAYLDAERYEEACTSFRRVLELQSGFSKAYQHLGEALKGLGNTSEAVAILTEGFQIAAERGAIMPQATTAGTLQQLGAALPSDQSHATAVATRPQADARAASRAAAAAAGAG